MNNLNTLLDNFSHTATSSNEVELAPCYNRCRDCPLFPYEQLASANINKGEKRGTFIIHAEHRKISSQGYRLICALTRQESTILPTDYLIQYVWPDSTIVKNNLNVAIYDLRILLRGTSIDIENHRKEGYCLKL